MMHLLVDISAHGFGHLSQTAPVLNALMIARPELRITVRSGLPEERLRQRIHCDFSHINTASDFGFVMHNAIDIDRGASAQRYRDLHADWPARVAEAAVQLRDMQVNLVLSNVAYLPLAAAAQSGIPAVAMCSLNWADLFLNCFRVESWAMTVYTQMLAAYCSAKHFLRVTPGMPMDSFPNRQCIGPLATLPEPDYSRRTVVAERLNIPQTAHWVLMAMGGMDFRQPIENWPQRDDIYWLVPEDWGVTRADVRSIERAGCNFTELLATVDAVLTKPGYGTFVEAACCGTPVVYVGRDDWPEEAPLVQWLNHNGRAVEVTRMQLAQGDFSAALAELWARPAPGLPQPTGIDDAVSLLLNVLDLTSAGAARLPTAVVR